jgi:hypothetical protein
MPVNISKRDNYVKDNLSGWDKLIFDAQKHIVRLKAAIDHAQQMKETGEPWPGTQSENQTAESCHSV